MLYAYTFVGLTPSESALLKSILNLEGSQDKALVPVHRVNEADLLFVNGDDSAVVQRLRQTNADALMVLVGQPPDNTLIGLPVLARPLDLINVIHVLSQLDWPREPRNMPIDFGSTFSLSTMSAPQSLSSTSSDLPSTVPPLDSPSALPGGSFEALPADPQADVLVVIGSNSNKPQTLSPGIRKLGYRVRVIEGADRARHALEWHSASFVFLDQVTLGAQLLPLARALSGHRRAADGPPYLIVVARHDSLFERLRARLLGCVWMVAPVRGNQLVAFFAHRGLVPLGAKSRH